MAIHPTALVDPKANLDSTVEVGAYAIIGPHVSIDAGTKIAAHVVIDGHTTIGKDNHFHSFSSIGGPPQDKKYAGEVTYLEIGDRNLIREFCTFNCGTVQDRGLPKLAAITGFLPMYILRMIARSVITPFFRITPHWLVTLKSVTGSS
jgi:UDP-N-acetylglucosamine acyltransferase